MTELGEKCNTKNFHVAASSFLWKCKLCDTFSVTQDELDTNFQ